MNNIYGVVLAAGQGTRMKSSLPKVLHKVCGKELLSHVIDCMNSAAKMDKLVVVVGNGSELVIKHLEQYKNAEYVFQEKRLGSAHALMQAEKSFKNLNGHLIVMCGDTPLVKAETLKALLKQHIKKGNSATVLSGTIENPFGYGRIVRNSEGKFTEIVEEKSASSEQKQINEINSGIYCFDLKTLWKALKKVNNKNSKKEYYLTDVISILNNGGYKTDAAALAEEQDILGINDRVQLAEADMIMRAEINVAHMQNGVTIVDPATTYIDKDVVIGQDTIIKPNTHIEGKTNIGKNCVIGPDTTITDCKIEDDVVITYSCVESSQAKKNVKIGPYSHIRPDTILKENVKVGNFSEVKKSVVGDDSKVNHLSYIGDANVGKKVNIGAGTITCNYDGRNKFKTVINDEVFVGSNVNLVAPVTIGKKVLIAAGSTITDDVLPNKLTIARARQITKVRKNK
ncbi:MAG: bifunctional UDP-N-acetylglucosamine diphosphorylase/glucosamine-1-phosphate N-acetyltransferase GlmU [Elusimicrobia bacterium]|nr:bifunctional UDP-N-acetylglucosamine diphosphorylase/glucosamine-1-phosphate N-acetyltransferase GlmU [Elusimicrobiota bacterium]